MGALTGIGGVSGLSGLVGSGVAPFTPDQIASVLMWLDPNFGAFSDAGTTPAVHGDPVYRWVAKYPEDGSVYAQQTTLNRRPILNIGANGKRSLVFNGANFMVVTASAAVNWSATDDRTMSVFLSLTGYPNTILCAIARYGAGVTTDTIYSEYADPKLNYKPLYLLKAGVQAVSTTAVPLNTWTLLTAKRIDAVGCYIYEGTTQRASAAASSQIGNTDIIIGGYDNALSFPIAAGVQHVVLARAAITDDELALHKAYCDAGVPT